MFVGGRPVAERRDVVGHLRSTRTLSGDLGRSAAGRFCCKSRFSPMTKILRAMGATFAYKMRGTSRPHAKFTGDFGNAIEVIRINDRSLLSVFAKNLEPCNFRLLQQNRPLAEGRSSACHVRCQGQTGRRSNLVSTAAFDPTATSRGDAPGELNAATMIET